MRETIAIINAKTCHPAATKPASGGHFVVHASHNKVKIFLDAKT
jgi:hypothetical protein